MIQLMNYRKNHKVKRLAYAITVNLLQEDELRRAIMKQANIDVMAKLIGILEKSTESGSNVSKEDTVCALKALSNALHDNLLLISFL